MPFAHYPPHYSEMKASLLYGLTIPTNLCRPLANARELLVQCNVGHCLHSGNATESYQHGNVIQFCTEENPRQAASLGKPKQHQPGVYLSMFTFCSESHISFQSGFQLTLTYRATLQILTRISTAIPNQSLFKEPQNMYSIDIKSSALISLIYRDV